MFSLLLLLNFEIAIEIVFFLTAVKLAFLEFGSQFAEYIL